jgi:hypothetical protein
MKDLRKQQVIKNAISEYRYRIATANWDKHKIVFAVNQLENIYIMCAPCNIDGTEKIRQLILDSKQIK